MFVFYDKYIHITVTVITVNVTLVRTKFEICIKLSSQNLARSPTPGLGAADEVLEMRISDQRPQTRDQTMAPTHGEDSNISNGRWSGSMNYRVGPDGPLSMDIALGGFKPLEVV